MKNFSCEVEESKLVQILSLRSGHKNQWQYAVGTFSLGYLHAEGFAGPNPRSGYCEFYHGVHPQKRSRFHSGLFHHEYYCLMPGNLVRY